MLSLLMTILLFMQHNLSLWWLTSMMLLIGVFSGYQALVFVIGEQLVPKILSNTAIAALNCFNMLGGAFFHKSIGLMLDNGTQAYSLYEYTIALSIIPVMSILGALLMCLFKKRH